MIKGLQLTDRDLSLLGSLQEMRVLSAAQIERLHFPSAQTARRRLRVLMNAGLVRRLHCLAVASTLVVLTPRGRSFARETDPESERPKHLRLPGPYFLAHWLAVNDFRIALREATARRTEVELLGLAIDQGQRGATRSQTASLELAVSHAGKALRHIPDAAFALRRAGRVGLFFVEIDRGTEVVGQGERAVGKCVRTYLFALARGVPTALAERLGLEHGPSSFRVLFVTTSAVRLGNIRKRWGTPAFSPEAAKQFFWLGTSSVLTAGKDLLSHTWVSLDPADSERYTILPREGS